jgi:hypothetical protein
MAVLGVAVIGSGLSGLYENYTGSTFQPRLGSFRVTSCKPAKHGYDCIGQFRQYGGMISVDTATFHSDHAYRSGDDIPNLWPHYSYQNAKERNLDDHSGAVLVTGEYLRGFHNNLINWLLIFTGVGLIGWLVIKDKLIQYNQH